jgi:hypothetical protein
MGVCQVQKRNEERKKSKEKEKKKVRGDQHIKGCGSHIFKSKSISIMKRYWRDYKIL